MLFCACIKCECMNAFCVWATSLISLALVLVPIVASSLVCGVVDCLVCVAASSFDLTVSPSTTAVKKENENTVFTCSVTGDKGSAQVNLAWYKTDGKTIIADTNTGSR